MKPYGMFGMVWYGLALYGMVWNVMVWYITIYCVNVWYSSLRHFTVRYGIYFHKRECAHYVPMPGHVNCFNGVV